MGRDGIPNGADRTDEVDWRSLGRSAEDVPSTRELVRHLEAAALTAADLGAYARAAETARIAVDVHRGLAEREETVVDPGLARALVGLGVFLFLAGRDGFLDAVFEGGRRYRELARGAPDAFAASKRVAADVASLLENCIRSRLERAAMREEGVEPPEPDLETVILLLSKVRRLHADDASGSGSTGTARC
jgi:hypothetical protein